MPRRSYHEPLDALPQAAKQALVPYKIHRSGAEFVPCAFGGVVHGKPMWVLMADPDRPYPGVPGMLCITVRPTLTAALDYLKAYAREHGPQCGKDMKYPQPIVPSLVPFTTRRRGRPRKNP